MLAWLPTYFTDTMNLSISQAAQFSLLPPLAALGTSAIAGPAADALISRGWDVAVVRKSAQCVAFLGPASCLLGASLLQNSYAPLGEPRAQPGLATRWAQRMQLRAPAAQLHPAEPARPLLCCDADATRAAQC